MNPTPSIEHDRIQAKAATILHPARSVLLGVLALEHSLGVEELAQRLGVSARTVRGHIGLLAEQGLVAIDREEGRRGVVKRYYTKRGSLQIDGREEGLLSGPERRRLSLAVIRMVVRELARAATFPGMARRQDRVVANVPGIVDSRGWDELSELHHEMLKRVEEVMAHARTRLSPGEEPIRVISEQILLETTSFQDGRPTPQNDAQKKLN